MGESWGKVGGKCVFFEKKFVFGVDKWVGVGYIELAPGPPRAGTSFNMLMIT